MHGVLARIGQNHVLQECDAANQNAQLRCRFTWQDGCHLEHDLCHRRCNYVRRRCHHHQRCFDDDQLCFSVSMFLLFTLERPLSPSYFADGTQLVVVVVLCSTYHRTSTVRRCCFSVGLRSRLTCLLSIRFSASQ